MHKSSSATALIDAVALVILVLETALVAVIAVGYVVYSLLDRSFIRAWLVDRRGGGHLRRWARDLHVGLREAAQFRSGRSACVATDASERRRVGLRCFPVVGVAADRSPR